MEVLMACPANVATGGVESIHKFAYELNKIEKMEVKIWYWGAGVKKPQPIEYSEYGIDYITKLPGGYKGAIIFPEIWANSVVDERFKDCKKMIHWLGVDAYYWNNPVNTHGLFLQQKDVIHLSQSQYATNHLLEKGVDKKNILHISDVPNALYYEVYEETPRDNVILYNPAKMTDFQQALMCRARDDYGLTFKPLANFTREQMADVMRHAKLYIDFGVWPGRERIPREAALSGCCVITSKLGCAQYYEDVALDDKWKFDTEPNNIRVIIETMKYILQNYDACKHEFASYRQSVIADRDNLHKDCETIAMTLLDANKSEKK